MGRICTVIGARLPDAASMRSPRQLPMDQSSVVGGAAVHEQAARIAQQARIRMQPS